MSEKRQMIEQSEIAWASNDGAGVIENGIDLLRGSELNRVARIYRYGTRPNRWRRARSADDRSRKLVGNAFVVSLILVF